MRFRTTVLAAIATLGCTAATAQAVPYEEVGDGGLRSPRHLDFAPSGNLYVAEAGRGGDGPCFVGGEGPACYGPTGAVTRIDRRGRQARIVDGLASYANDTDGDGALEPGEADSGIGPHGIVALADNGVFVTNGGPTAVPREDIVAEDRTAWTFGRLLWVYGRQRFLPVADIYDFERRRNPDGGAIDTNATDVLYDRGRFVISDAGGNSVLRAFGPRLSTLSVFPDDPATGAQAVPTGIVEGPDGAYYMSQLTGFPFPVGAARVFRIDPRTGASTALPYAFTNIMDLAFDRQGTLYVLEFDANGLLAPPNYGAIHAISRSGKRRVVVPADPVLTDPGGIAVGPRGDLYVTVNSRSPDSGRVIRLRG